MRIFLFVSAAIISHFYSNGQSNPNRPSAAFIDSVKARYVDSLAWNIASLRQAGLSTEVFAPGNIRSDLKGNSFFRGKYQAVRTNLFLNVPIFHHNKNIISGGIAISHQTMHLYNMTGYDSTLKVGNLQVHNTLVGASMSFTHVDSLFKRPVIFSATANGLTDPTTGQYRLSYSGLVAITLRRTDHTSLSIGLLVLPDPTAPAPVIPFISYYHKFKSGIVFSLDPSAVFLKKELNSRNTIAISNNINGNLSLFRRDIVNLPMNQVYSTFEMKSGLVYERLLTKKSVLSISSGVASTFTSKVLDQNSGKTAFIKNTQSMVPYIKMGISFLPFWKGFVKP